MHDESADGVPAFPEYEGHWAAVYYEPIPCSGERITIAVVAWDKEGLMLTRTLPEGVLSPRYDSQVQQLLDAVKFHMDEGRRQDLGVPGITIGSARLGIGNDRADVLSQGIALSSSLVPVGIA